MAGQLDGRTATIYVQLLCRGEAADVDSAVVDDWSKRLSSICTGYRIEDIFNADETGLFFRALPTHSMVVKGDQASGGKKSKDRISVLLACSAAGEKLEPFVIGHSAKRRCFRGLTSPLCLPVIYDSAWMTSDLFKQWLDKVNNKMITKVVPFYCSSTTVLLTLMSSVAMSNQFFYHQMLHLSFSLVMLELSRS